MNYFQGIHKKNTLISSEIHMSFCNLFAKYALSRSFATLKKEMQTKSKKSYKEAIEALNSLQTNQQYIKNAIANPKAESNIAEMMKYLERTDLSLETLDSLRVIHIAGTNGKGSTCAYCESILRKHGYTTGFYSSPHLLDVRERIRINGRPISKNKFAEHFWKIYDKLDKQKTDIEDMPLYFRYLTILAFHVFIEHKVDVAIIEVGIGGEYDCTNVLRKTAIAGIAPLDFDHMPLLGNSMESIAWNKGGIMKKNCITFTVEQPEAAMKILEQRSIEKQCTLNIVDKNHYRGQTNTNIPSPIGKTNASLALAISEAFTKIENNTLKVPFSFEIAKKSIEDTHWHGRYELIEFNNGRFYLDGAHTLESIAVCVDWYQNKTENSNRKKLLIFNLTGGRNPQTFFKVLSKIPFDYVIFTPNVGSEKDSKDTTDFVQTVDSQLEHCKEYQSQWLSMIESTREISGTVKVFPNFSKAMNFIEKEGDCDVLITGSLHLIGAALSILNPTLSGTLNS